MDKNAIKKYAVWARRELISRVSQKAHKFGITEKNIVDASADSVNGHLLSADEKKQRQALIARIRQKGYEQVMEEVAYTWFNRFIALRFMEVNGYLPTHVRVFTDEQNSFKPQILAEAIHLELDGLNMDKVYALKEANNDEALYKYLLITQCNALSAILPGMFQRIADDTELLFPDNLLREGSALEQMVTLIPEADWQDQVQIIGWLYQYYNSEPKDKVFADLKKNIKISKEKIPAATQLFTPDWIVRYMVENSLGRLWTEGHPDGELKANWEYYLEEAQQEPEVEAQLAEIRKEYATLKPEDIRCIDPCMGSGHILVYMFDVLMQIYESYGYTARDAVRSIVTNNLYGLDIDDRAAQLAYFAVMMTARQYDSRFFTRGIQPHVYAICESNGISADLADYFCGGDKKLKADMASLITEMHDAKEYGSILNITPVDFDALYDRFDALFDEISMYDRQLFGKLLPLVQVAQTLAQKYDVVVTNPPYMGSSGMSAKLSEYVKKYFTDSKSDLFACFISKGNSMVKRNCFNSMVTMQSWMFLSSFEKMRTSILDTKCITNLMHMENMVMGIAFGTAVTVFRNCRLNGYKGTYNQIKLQDIDNDSPKAFPIAGNRFAQVSTDNFSKIPGSPVAYWASEKLIGAFSHRTVNQIGSTKQGLATGDNDRFLRFWHEVSINRIGFNARNREFANLSGYKWFPCNKGGTFRRWYGNFSYVVNWENDGKEIRSFHGSNGRLASRPQNIDYYFREGITWSTLSSGLLSMRFSPNGTMFETKGSMCFFNNKDDLLYVISVMNSIVVNSIVAILCPTLDYHEGPVGCIPIIIANKQLVIDISKRNINMARNDWDSFETSWDFQRHPLVEFRIKNEECKIKDNSSFFTLHSSFKAWERECNERFNALLSNEEELNRIFIDIYGLQDELTPEVEDKDVTVRLADKKRDIRSLISYAVGCMFGRYSLDAPGLAYAGGEWDASKYNSFPADRDNVIPICDDEYFDDDIVGRFVKLIETVYGKETLNENLNFIADALGGSGQPREVIRSYFLNDFYADHLKIYQKRPIYWLFDSGKKGGFKALIYMHRYQPDTIARMRTDYVHEQQARYRTAIADLGHRIENASTAERVKLTKQLVKLQGQADEIRVYEEKIHHLADQMIRIDLDDGVKHNYAIFGDVLAKIK